MNSQGNAFSLTFAGNPNTIMRTFFTLLFPLFIPFFVIAQGVDTTQAPKHNRPVYLDLTGGVSLPVGKSYSSADKTNSSAGYATTGYFIQVNFAYLGKSKLGIGAQYTFQHNPIISSVRTDTLEGTKYPVGNKGWSNNYILVGPAYIQSFKKVTVQVHPLIGFIIAFSPVFNDTDPRDGTNHQNTANGLALAFRAGVGYNITSKLTLVLNVNWLGGYPKIDKKYEPVILGYDETTGEPIYSAKTEVNIKKTVSTFNIGAGLMYKF